MHRHPNYHWNYRFTCLPRINDTFRNRYCTCNWCIFWLRTKRSSLWICIQVHTNQNKFPLHKNQLVFRLSITDVCNVIKYRMLRRGSINRIQVEDNLIAHSLRCFMAPMSPFRIFTRSRWRRGFRRGFRPPTAGYCSAKAERCDTVRLSPNDASEASQRSVATSFDRPKGAPPRRRILP